MAEHIINLSADQEIALTEMGVILQSYIESICNNHISQKINEQLQAKTLEEKKALLAE